MTLRPRHGRRDLTGIEDQHNRPGSSLGKRRQDDSSPDTQSEDGAQDGSGARTIARREEEKDSGSEEVDEFGRLADINKSPSRQTVGESGADKTPTRSRIMVPASKTQHSPIRATVAHRLAGSPSRIAVGKGFKVPRAEASADVHADGSLHARASPSTIGVANAKGLPRLRSRTVQSSIPRGLSRSPKATSGATAKSRARPSLNAGFRDRASTGIHENGEVSCPGSSGSQAASVTSSTLPSRPSSALDLDGRLSALSRMSSGTDGRPMSRNSQGHRRASTLGIPGAMGPPPVSGGTSHARRTSFGGQSVSSTSSSVQSKATSAASKQTSSHESGKVPVKAAKDGKQKRASLAGPPLSFRVPSESGSQQQAPRQQARTKAVLPRHPTVNSLVSRFDGTAGNGAAPTALPVPMSKRGDTSPDVFVNRTPKSSGDSTASAGSGITNSSPSPASFRTAPNSTGGAAGTPLRNPALAQLRAQPGKRLPLPTPDARERGMRRLSGLRLAGAAADAAAGSPKVSHKSQLPQGASRPVSQLVTPHTIASANSASAHQAHEEADDQPTKSAEELDANLLASLRMMAGKAGISLDKVRSIMETEMAARREADHQAAASQAEGGEGMPQKSLGADLFEGMPRSRSWVTVADPDSSADMSGHVAVIRAENGRRNQVEGEDGEGQQEDDNWPEGKGIDEEDGDVTLDLATLSLSPPPDSPPSRFLPRQAGNRLPADGASAQDGLGNDTTLAGLSRLGLDHVGGHSTSTTLLLTDDALLHELDEAVGQLGLDQSRSRVPSFGLDSPDGSAGGNVLERGHRILPDEFRSLADERAEGESGRKARSSAESIWAPSDPASTHSGAHSKPTADDAKHAALQAEHSALHRQLAEREAVLEAARTSHDERVRMLEDALAAAEQRANTADEARTREMETARERARFDEEARHAVSEAAEEAARTLAAERARAVELLRKVEVLEKRLDGDKGDAERRVGEAEREAREAKLGEAVRLWDMVASTARIESEAVRGQADLVSCSNSFCQSTSVPILMCFFGPRRAVPFPPCPMRHLGKGRPEQHTRYFCSSSNCANADHLVAILKFSKSAKLIERNHCLERDTPFLLPLFTPIIPYRRTTS